MRRRAPESLRGWVAADATVPCHSHSNQLPHCLWTWKSFGELKVGHRLKKPRTTSQSCGAVYVFWRPPESQVSAGGQADMRQPTHPFPVHLRASPPACSPAFSLNGVMGTFSAICKSLERDFTDDFNLMIGYKTA